MPWIELSLICTSVPRRDDDPKDIDSRAVVLAGEGVLQSREARPLARRDGLGDGLFVLRAANVVEKIDDILAKPEWMFRLAPGKHILFLFGFVKRPPVLVTPLSKLGLPARRVGRAHHYVQTEKAALLDAVSGVAGDNRAAAAKSRERLALLLDRAGGLVGRNLRDADARLVGDVLVADEIVFQEPPVSWEAVKPPVEQSGGGRRPKPASEALVSVRPDDVQGDRLGVQLRLMGTDGSVVADSFHEWRRGAPTTWAVDAGQGIQRGILRAWSNGELVHEDERYLLHEIQTRTVMNAGEVTLLDRLSTRVDRATRRGGGGGVTRATADAVTKAPVGGLANTMRVGVEHEPWRQTARAAQKVLFDRARPAFPQHAFFPRGWEGRAQAVVAFANLIRKAEASWLIDPFFDSVGAEALIPRIASAEGKVTIVTSLLADREVEALVEAIEQLSLGQLVPGRLRVVRVISQAGEQAFHDRFLITESGNDRPRGYALTNSLSGLARNYSLCVADLHAGVTGAILDELDALLDDKSGNQIIELWPVRAQPPFRFDAKRAAYAPGWQLYLSRLFRRAGRSESNWLGDAAAAGYLQRDASGGTDWLCQRLQRPQLLDRVLPTRATCIRQMIGTSSRIAMLGALGELRARGLQLPTAEVAARLDAGDVHAIEERLRATFCAPADPNHPFEGGGRHTMAFRQAMARRTVLVNDIRGGQALWSSSHELELDHASRTRRRFLYSLLAIKNPRAAIRVGEDLLDCDLLLGLLDDHSMPDEWSLELSRALLGAKSAILRALGAQSIASPNTRGWHDPWPRPPENVEACFQQLTEYGVSTEDRGLLAIAWAVAGAQDEERRHKLASVAYACGASATDETRSAIVETALPVVAVAGTIVALASGDEAPASSAVLRMAVDAFWRGAPLDRTHFFSVQFDLSKTSHIACAIAALARRTGVAADALVRELTDRPQLVARTSKVTPLRRAQEWRNWWQPHGWSLLLEVLALDGRPVSPATVAATFEFLAEDDDVRCADLRGTLHDSMQPAATGIWIASAIEESDAGSEVHLAGVLALFSTALLG